MSRNVLRRFDIILLMINIMTGKTLTVMANDIIMTDGFISSLGMILPSLLLLLPYIVVQLPPLSAVYAHTKFYESIVCEISDRIMVSFMRVYLQKRQTST